MRDSRREWVNAAAALCVVGWLMAAGAGCRSSRHPAVGDLGDAADDDADRTGDARGGDTGNGGGGDGRVAPGPADGGDGRADGAGAGPGTGGDAAAADAGSDGAIGDAGYGAGCNALTTAAPVTVVCAGDAGSPPVPAGGPIVPGTYRLTAVTAYGPCIELDVAQTLTITATTIQTIVDDPITGVSRANATYAVAAAGSMAQTNSCPDNAMRTLGYTASAASGAAPATLTLISSDQGTTTVAVLTRQ